MTTTPDIVQQALDVLHARILTTPFLSASEDSKNYFRLRLAPHEREVFCVAFITSQNQIIACEDLFQGTLDGSSVYPREVVKRALHHNAAACVFAHNHPSGLTTPSPSDERITQRLTEALALVDVRVLDHIVVSHAGATSFAEQGLL
jgi:DNA repair protein RadC